jgi:hypothetical protein
VNIIWIRIEIFKLNSWRKVSSTRLVLLEVLVIDAL